MTNDEEKKLMAEGVAALASIGVDVHAAAVRVGKETMLKLIKAEAEIDRLRAALWDYGEHTLVCRVRDGGVCDCGFHDLLKTVPPPTVNEQSAVQHVPGCKAMFTKDHDDCDCGWKAVLDTLNA